MTKRPTHTDILRLQSGGLPAPSPIRFFIGIDCGVNTGLAVWDSSKQQFFYIGSMMIHQAFKYIDDFQANHLLHGIKVIVEDARQVKFKTDYVKAQGAGSVKRDALAWEDYLKDAGLPFVMVRPNKAITKMTQEQFNRQTKWNRSTNSHARDAAMLVYQY